MPSTYAKQPPEVWLDAYQHDTLIQIALATGVLSPDAPKPNKRDTLVLLAPRLFQRERVLANYTALHEIERRVLHRLILRYGEASKRSFERELVRARIVTATQAAVPGLRPPPYAPTERSASALPDSLIFQDVMARLTLHGLLFSADPAGDGRGTVFKLSLHPGSLLFIPPAVLKHLPAVTPEKEAVIDLHPARTLHENALTFVRDLFLYWDFVRRTQPALLQSGAIGKRTLRAVNDALIQRDPDIADASGETDVPRLWLLRVSLQNLGLIAAQGGQLVAKSDKPGKFPSLWNGETHEQLVALLRPRLAVRTDAGAMLGNIGNEWLRNEGTAWPVTMRALHNGAGRWVDMDTLTDVARQIDPGFLAPQRKEKGPATAHYYYRGRYFSNRDVLLDAIDEDEVAFVTDACRTLPYSLGLIELGFLQANDKMWQAVRLTPIGRQVLAQLFPPPAAQSPAQVAEAGGVYPAPSPDDRGRIVVQPNFQVLALGPVKTVLIAGLESFAERTKADAHVFEYQLKRESVYRAQQQGTPVDTIVNFLETESGAPLPQNVRRSLQEWGSHHDRIVFRTGVTLLQTGDAATLEQLLGDAALAPHVARSLMPELALVAKGHEDALVQDLLARGKLPTLVDDNSGRTDKDVIVHADGTLVPIHRVPSIFLVARLVRIAEQDAEGRWRLTPASVARAGGDRARVQALLAEVGLLHRGVLPEALVADIKRWGSYYGQAAIEALTLVEFDSRDHLQELVAVPALAAYLTPFAAGERALAVVKSADLPAVERIVNELGVKVRRGL